MTPNIPNDAIADILGACGVPGYSKPEDHLIDVVMEQVKEYGLDAITEICGILSAAIISTLSLYHSTAPRDLNLRSLAAGTNPHADPADQAQEARLASCQYLSAWNDEDVSVMHQLVHTHQGKALRMMLDLCIVLYTVNIAQDNVASDGEPVNAETMQALLTGAERDPATFFLPDPVYLACLLDSKHGDAARRQILDALAERMCQILELDTVREKHQGVPLQLIMFDVNGMPFDDLEPATAAQAYVTAWLQNDEPGMDRLSDLPCTSAMMLVSGLCSVLHWLYLGQKASR